MPQKTKIIVSVALIPVIILGYYLSIYRSYYYQSDNLVIGAVMIIISVMIYRMLWIEESKSRAKKIGLIVAQVIIAITVLISLFIIESNFENDEIDKNGVNTDAQVTGIEIVSSRKRGDSYYATVQYSFDNHTIIQRISDDDRNYKAGDLVKIRFSKKYPEMFRVIKKSK